MNTAAIALVAALVVPAVPAVVQQGPTPQLSSTTPAYVERVAAAVVGIDTKIPLDRPSVLTLGPVRTGSGVIFDPAGYAVTVGYILSDANVIQVRLRDG